MLVQEEHGFQKGESAQGLRHFGAPKTPGLDSSNRSNSHEQIIYISSNCRMKQLEDWLSNSHWTLDTGMLTYLPLSNGTQADGDHSCPVQRCFEELTSHQLDLIRSTVHAKIALKSERSALVTPGHLLSGAYYIESSKSTHLLYFQPLLFSCCDPYGVAMRASYSGDPFAARKRVWKGQEVSKAQYEPASQSKPLNTD